MTQQKKGTKSQKQINLRDEYLKFSEKDQQGITHFFNLHNGAHFIYDNLSDEAKKYVNYCIRLSSEADKIEKQS